MPSSADRTATAVYSTPSPGRRILSRITSPFAAKSRSIPDFYIQPDEPHRQYSPGDLVTGSVKLRVLRPTRVTHIVVSLHGYVQVYKNPGSPGDGLRANAGNIGTGRGKQSGEYYGNGFASLFEDEVVLCGDGRLAEGSYQFNFELEFPDTDLPSSIDFERGTISYMITGTMTRPTTISPTMTCDRKIYFVERIDISPLYPPKPRTITLEPISRRTRARHQAKKLVDPSDRRSRKTDSASHSDVPHDGQSVAPSTIGESDEPLSPSPSEISFDSAVSGSRRTSHPDSNSMSPGSSSNANVNNSKASIATTRTITTEIESCVGGCLRGDYIPVKININHTKHIKSMNGIIVTLYRSARVDLHPVIPLGPTEKGSKPKYEDYYPRSVTGLGGLSLSGAGSHHVFRKDLAQTVQPLIVHPGSLSAETTIKVRVPDDAFPTISTVPGSMIGFKYYVEVLVDIQGKLGVTGSALGNLGGMATKFAGADDYDAGRSGLATFGSTLIDTAPIRRDKSVVSCAFEVIIGTRDSERRKGKQKVDVLASVKEPESLPQNQANRDPTTIQPASHEQDYANRPPEEPWDYNYDYSGNGFPYGYDSTYYQDAAHTVPPEVPMPFVPDESHLSEKERIQRAENRLLPSQPLAVEEEQVAGGASEEATAPYLPEESQFYVSSLETSITVAGPSSGAQVFDPSGHGYEYEQPPAPAPDYDVAVPESSRTTNPAASDDKAELQRRRLEAEASAPPADDEVAGPSSSDVPHVAHHTESIDAHVPAVPLAADVHDSHADAAESTELPVYER